MIFPSQISKHKGHPAVHTRRLFRWACPPKIVMKGTIFMPVFTLFNKRSSDVHKSLHTQPTKYFYWWNVSVLGQLV